jgi:hypothetical protein
MTLDLTALQSEVALTALHGEIARTATVVLALEHYRRPVRRSGCGYELPGNGEMHLWKQEKRLLELLDREEELLAKQPTCEERNHEPSTD